MTVTNGRLCCSAIFSDFSYKEKKNLEYLDPDTNEKYLPYVIETSVGCDRSLLAVMCDAYRVENKGDKEKILRNFQLLYNRSQETAHRFFEEALKLQMQLFIV